MKTKKLHTQKKMVAQLSM